ncbi:MAG: hypothetical protein IPL60_02840 [Ardenticatenia bacterium]|nr:hypothetical protein [Ardenticatenia bacterium]
MTVSAAVTYAAGDFAGNIDLSVAIEPLGGRSAVIDNLRLRLPGSTVLLDVLGSEDVDAGVALTYYTSALIGAARPPDRIEVVWAADGSLLGSVSCRLEPGI